ncbi:MAG TPA: DUF721 domain-containing protein [Thermoanaerobacterales bacterium]|nr:DUF721 domain-containing protein [Thermoanaerobacterales bacterium]
MEKIGTILLNSLKKTRLNKRLMEAKIFVNYELMVGEKISEISKPVFMQNNILFIGVENHIWIHQLYFLKPELIDNINSNLPRPLVKDIRFQVRNIEKIKKPEPILETKQDQHFEIPEKTMKVIYNICQSIDDEDLRKIFTRLMIKDSEYKLKKGEKRCLST